MNFFARIFFLFLITVSPVFAAASLEITEIMYDLPGGDTDREWVEIYNNGEEDVDVSVWKFFEEGTNHNLTIFQGDAILVKGGYAVIVDKPEKFLIDWPNFSGVIFDSSFSLKNTGETLIMRDADLNDIDSVNYTSDWGAEGDGNSLQKISGEWKAASPTPGAANSAAESQLQDEGSPSSQSSQESSSSQSQNSSASSANVVFVEEKIYASAGGDKAAIVGADTEFRGMAFGFKKEPLDNAGYLWNFGDGEYRSGQNVMHSYKYPGEYIAVLNVSSGNHSASDRISVKVSENKIKILEVNSNFIKIKNGSNVDVDISGWFLRGSGNLFSFPKNSFVKNGSVITVASSVTKVVVNDFFRIVELLYPNGSLADLYVFPYEKAEMVAIDTPRSSSSIPPSPEKDFSNNKVSSVIISLPNENKAVPSSEENKLADQILSNPSVDVSEGEIIVIGSEEKEKNSLKIWLTVVASTGIFGIAGLYAIRRDNNEKDK